jgi:hypothetical protein
MIAPIGEEWIFLSSSKIWALYFSSNRDLEFLIRHQNPETNFRKQFLKRMLNRYGV